jgi:formamidopyrimidine-DNA glycosylase
MPELPEVETVRRGLEKVTQNLVIIGGEVLLPRTIAYPHNISQFLTGLENRAIASWQRRGKYLLGYLEEKGKQVGWLVVHLRMTGQLLWVKQDTPLQKHTRVRFFFPNNQELRFVDQRTFGKIWLAPNTLFDVVTGLTNMGPEPFSSEFSVQYLQERLQGKLGIIKSALLDQTLIAGLGNIYADEVLFLAGLRPNTVCANIKRSQIKKLHQVILQVLEQAIEAGGTSFSDFVHITGVNGNYAGMAWVYGREAEPCRRCGSLIERIKLAGRSSHFCPKCQI